MECISHYSFTAIHVQGKNNKVADHYSRFPTEIQDTDKIEKYKLLRMASSIFDPATREGGDKVRTENSQYTQFHGTDQELNISKKARTDTLLCNEPGKLCLMTAQQAICTIYHRSTDLFPLHAQIGNLLTRQQLPITATKLQEAILTDTNYSLLKDELSRG